jgi:hypothetical protein
MMVAMAEGTDKSTPKQEDAARKRIGEAVLSNERSREKRGLAETWAG